MVFVRPQNWARSNTMARKDSLVNLRAILVRRRDALRSALAGDLSLLKDLRSESPGDVIDAAYDSTQDEISSQLAEVESRELANIENALERMRAGKYGSCEVCNGKIPLARLNALPYATMCIDCQRELERSGSVGGAGYENPEEQAEETVAGDLEF
jgi:DnaK suppressor protein